jgi:hypothetical protein
MRLVRDLARLLPIALFGVGCVEYTLEVSDGTDVFVQQPAEKVDILMIVDNSGSMAPYQQKLGQSFDAFITYFVGANVDYHIGVTTTDIGYDPTTHGAAGLILGEVITPETGDPSGDFAQIVNVGTTGSGFEMGLEAAKMALTPPKVNGVNQGFLRDDASLSIIFVSDEQDSSPEPVNDYINEFFEIKGQRDREVFNASALTVTDESECTAQQALASSPGTRYVDVAAQTHGLTGNLCADAVTFDRIVTDLSLNASRLTATFFLSANPDPATIAVSVDGVEVGCDVGDWTYDEVDDGTGNLAPAVIFTLDALPDVGSQITIRYNYGDGDPAAFCVSP